MTRKQVGTTIADGNTGREAGSLPRAARILSHLAGHRGNLSIREMSEALDIPRSTLHRVLHSLENLGFLETTETGNYTWGAELRRIAGAVLQTKELNRLAAPVLRHISLQLNETSLLSIYDAKTCGLVFVEQAQGDQPIRYHPTLNVPRPVYAGASGRSIMAFLPPAEIDRIIANGLRPLTEDTITDVGKLKQMLATVRAKGYAISKGERTVGAVGIGCPILGSEGWAIGGVMVTIPEYRYKKSMEKKIISAVRDGAARISRQIGS